MGVGEGVSGYFVDSAGHYYGFNRDGGIFVGFSHGSFTITAGQNDYPDLVGGWDQDGDGSGCLNPGAGSCRGVYWSEEGPFEIHFPGSTSTMVFGLSGSGSMVGAYTDAASVVHGFHRGFLFSTIDPPDAVLSFATGINNNEDIVGRWDTADGVTHGYLRQGGDFTLLDAPNAVSTIAWGIDDARTIVGEYADGDGVTHGFRLSNNVFETIDFPGALATTCHGVRYDQVLGDTYIVGSYTDSNGTTHGFVLAP